MPDHGQQGPTAASLCTSPTAGMRARLAASEAQLGCNPAEDLDASARLLVEPVAVSAADNNDAWTCPICLSWFDMPVAPPCRHSFCSGCLKTFVRAAARRAPANAGQPARPACPICRETFSPQEVVPNGKMFEEMLKAEVVCKNAGCGVQFCPLRWKHHQEECPSASVQCSHQSVGCAWRGNRRDLSAHLETCAYEKIKGLIPRVSASLKQVHTQMHALEARVMAQNTRLAETRSFLMGLHQRERRGAIFPAMYALLWRPPGWRRYSCPNSEGVLWNATLVCFAPIAFLALWGAGVFGSGSGASIVQRGACLAGLAMLGLFALAEYDNSAPWYELRRSGVFGGLKVGPFLLECTTRLVVVAAIKPLPPPLQLTTGFLLLAPLTYPTVVQGLHRFQVHLRQAQMQARQSTPSRSRIWPSPVKVYRPTVNGVICAFAMLMFGSEVVLVAEILSKLFLCAASSCVGPELWDGFLDKMWTGSNIGRSVEEKEHIKQLTERNQRATKAPLPSWTSTRARACVVVSSLLASSLFMSLYSDSLETMGYSLVAMNVVNKVHLMWDIHVSRWIMASLEQTTTQINHGTESMGNATRDLWRSRLLLLWVLFGSVSFVLLAPLSSNLMVGA